MRLHAITAVLILVCTATPTVSGNLIVNGGFEAGGTRIDSSGNWFQTADDTKHAIQNASWAAESGDRGVWIKGWNTNGGAGEDQHFYQDVTGTAGLTYTLDSGFRIENNYIPNGAELEMAIVWLNASSAEISRTTLDVDANYTGAAGWEHLFISDVAPTGTATVRAWFQWTTDGVTENGSQTSAFVDNVTLFATPEPSSLVLFGLGLVGLSRRKRR